MAAILPGNASAGKKSDGEWDPQRSGVCAPFTPDFSDWYRTPPSGSARAGAAGSPGAPDIRQSRRS
jgi:hypothetical protein